MREGPASAPGGGQVKEGGRRMAVSPGGHPGRGPPRSPGSRPCRSSRLRTCRLSTPGLSLPGRRGGHLWERDSAAACRPARTRLDTQVVLRAPREEQPVTASRPPWSRRCTSLPSGPVFASVSKQRARTRALAVQCPAIRRDISAGRAPLHHPPPPLCPRPSLAPLPHQRPRSHLSRDTLCLRITCGRQGRRRPYPFSSGLVLVWFYRLLSLQTSGPDQPHPERMRR